MAGEDLHTDDYILFRLTDTAPILDGMAKLGGRNIRERRRWKCRTVKAAARENGTSTCTGLRSGSCLRALPRP